MKKNLFLFLIMALASARAVEKSQYFNGYSPVEGGETIDFLSEAMNFMQRRFDNTREDDVQNSGRVLVQWSNINALRDVLNRRVDDLNKQDGRASPDMQQRVNQFMEQLAQQAESLKDRVYQDWGTTLPTILMQPGEDILLSIYRIFKNEGDDPDLFQVEKIEKKALEACEGIESRMDEKAKKALEHYVKKYSDTLCQIIGQIHDKKVQGGKPLACMKIEVPILKPRPCSKIVEMSDIKPVTSVSQLAVSLQRREEGFFFDNSVTDTIKGEAVNWDFLKVIDKMGRTAVSIALLEVDGERWQRIWSKLGPDSFHKGNAWPLVIKDWRGVQYPSEIFDDIDFDQHQQDVDFKNWKTQYEKKVAQTKFKKLKDVKHEVDALKQFLRDAFDWTKTEIEKGGVPYWTRLHNMSTTKSLSDKTVQTAKEEWMQKINNINDIKDLVRDNAGLGRRKKKYFAASNIETYEDLGEAQAMEMEKIVNALKELERDADAKGYQRPIRAKERRKQKHCSLLLWDVDDLKDLQKEREDVMNILNHYNRLFDCYQCAGNASSQNLILFSQFVDKWCDFHSFFTVHDNCGNEIHENTVKFAQKQKFWKKQKGQLEKLLAEKKQAVDKRHNQRAYVLQCQKKAHEEFWKYNNQGKDLKKKSSSVKDPAEKQSLWAMQMDYAKQSALLLEDAFEKDRERYVVEGSCLNCVRNLVEEQTECRWYIRQKLMKKLNNQSDVSKDFERQLQKRQKDNRYKLYQYVDEWGYDPELEKKAWEKELGVVSTAFIDNTPNPQKNPISGSDCVVSESQNKTTDIVKNQVIQHQVEDDKTADVEGTSPVAGCTTNMEQEGR